MTIMPVHDVPLVSALLGAAALALSMLAAPVLAVSSGDAQSAPPSVTYTVSLESPQTQMVEISVTFPEVLGTSLEVALPVWRPGKYAIIDAAGTVRDVRASIADGDGKARGTPIVKIDKSTWRVSLPPRAASDAPPHAVTVSYRVYANSLADRTRHVDDSHAFLSGAAVFMYAEEFRSHPVRVVVEAPEGWRTATGLEPDAADANVFTGASYDVLVDSPLEIGLHDVIPFEVDGIPHEIVAWPPGKLGRDAETITAEFASIIGAQRDIFGDLPYRRYVFILHITPDARGGTEHLNSFVAQTSPGAFNDPKAYRGFLGLISHEMFHTWNVKQLRPSDIHPYDYRRENYTTLLWVVEGTTSYFDDLTLVRASGADGKPLMTPGDYLKALSGAINSERGRPGLAAQSLADSSFDAWIKFNKPSPDAVNSTVSFYSKGALVSFLLDLEVRKRTSNRVSYDDVLRTLYQRFPLSGAGYAAADLLDVLDELTGSEFSGFLEENVSRPSKLLIEEAAGAVGLELVFEHAKGDDDEEVGDHEGAAEVEAPEKAYLGLGLSDTGGKAIVTASYADGPAYTAGIIPGDEIVALDGSRLRAADLDARLKELAPGQEVQIALFRRDELRTIPITLDGRPDGKWVLRRVKDATDEQKAAYASWLGREWPGGK